MTHGRHLAEGSGQRNHPHMKLTHLVFVALLTSLSGCGLSPQETQLAKAQSRWNALHLVDYDFDLEQSCFCVPRSNKVHVTVKGGQITEIKDSQSGEIISYDNAGWVTSIEGFFERLLQEQDVAKWSATFEPTLGYPTDIRLDPIPGAVDDEVAFRLTLNPLLPF